MQCACGATCELVTWQDICCLGFKARQDLGGKAANKGESRTQVSICCAKAALSSLSPSLLFSNFI